MSFSSFDVAGLGFKVFLFPIFLTLLTANTLAAGAPPTLPYTTRTNGYSGWSTTVLGDIRTIGIAGATVGLADSFIGSIDNPAGIAMLTGNTGLQLTKNQIHDADIQSYDQTISATNIGAAGASYPWGFSVGFWTPKSEKQPYSLADGSVVEPEIFIREFRASAARVFLENKLALGMSLTYGRASKNFDFPAQPERNDADASYSVGGNLGLMIQFPRRWLLGANYSFPQLYVGDPNNSPPSMPGFYQPVKTPWRFAIGTGWMPNRLFRFGITFQFIGPTSQVALLANDHKLVGENLNFQPRLGASYTAIEFKELQVEVSAGTYLEVSRIADTPTRLHATAGIEINPWIFSLGWGIDEAPRYRNYVYSAGINVLKIMRKLDLLPPEWRPPYGGFLSSPFHLSEEGLARPLVKNWKEHKQEDIIEVTKQIPERLEEKAKKTEKQIKEAIQFVPNTLKTLPEKLRLHPRAKQKATKPKPQKKKP